MTTAITFDFHNTLVECDEWFALEVTHLPSAFLAWHDTARTGAPSTGSTAGLDEAYRRLRRAIIGHGHELSAARCLRFVFDRAGIDVSDEAINKGLHDLMNSALEHAKLVPGALATVREIGEAGCALAVVSSAVYHPFLEWSLERFALLELFNVVTSSATSGYYKSRPEIYWDTLAMLRVSPEQSAHVGDSARFDADGAARAGMRTVWLSDGRGEPPAREPDLKIASLEGAAASILGLVGSDRR